MEVFYQLRLLSQITPVCINLTGNKTAHWHSLPNMETVFHERGSISSFPSKCLLLIAPWEEGFVSVLSLASYPRLVSFLSPSRRELFNL